MSDGRPWRAMGGWSWRIASLAVLAGLAGAPSLGRAWVDGDRVQSHQALYAGRAVSVLEERDDPARLSLEVQRDCHDLSIKRLLALGSTEEGLERAREGLLQFLDLSLDGNRLLAVTRVPKGEWPLAFQPRVEALRAPPPSGEPPPAFPEAPPPPVVETEEAPLEDPAPDGLITPPEGESQPMPALPPDPDMPDPDSPDPNAPPPEADPPPPPPPQAPRAPPPPPERDLGPMTLLFKERLRDAEPDGADRLDLPPGTLLAPELLQRLRREAGLDRAKVINALVVDPTLWGHPVTLVAAEILERFAAKPQLPRVEPGLLEGAGIRLRLTYYAVDSLEVDHPAEVVPLTPSLAERELTLYDNGILGDFTERQGDWTFTMTLVGVQPLEDRACPPR